MYSILISLLLGAAAGATWTLLGLWKTWAMGIIVGVFVSTLSFVVIGRVLKRKLEPAFLQAQKQIEAGKLQLGLASLEALMPLTRWQILLKGQLYGQMGSLCFSAGDFDRALEYLEKSTPRMADSQMILASLQYRRGNYEEAKKVLEKAIGYNKKQMLLYNLSAYLRLKEGDRAGAAEELMRGLKIEKDNESTRDNLLRVQNGKKMNMKRFGMTWYALQLEKPPASMRQQQQVMGRRGFRQPKRKRR